MLNANSADPDQMPQYAESDLSLHHLQMSGLHRLQMSGSTRFANVPLYGVGHKWVKIDSDDDGLVFSVTFDIICHIETMEE